MTAQFEAAWEIHSFLSDYKTPYVIIGGFAVQYWGEPRFTRDVDVIAAVPLGKDKDFVQLIVKDFTPRVQNIINFACQTRVIPVRAQNGCEIDITLSIPGYEDQVIEQSIDYELEPGKVVRLCSAEDLIIHKAVAGRPRDCQDIEGVVYRQRDSLKTKYIRTWLKEFALVLEDPEVVDRFEQPWHKLHSR